MKRLLHILARRCETHDRPSYAKTRRLEEQLGMAPSDPPATFTEQYCDPDLIDCGNSWCQHRR